MSDSPALPSPPGREVEYDLRLYVAGATPRSTTAFRNLQTLCEEHLSGRFTIKVIDLMKDPKLALTDQILAVPTLVRTLPKPVCRIVGTLANAEKVIAKLDLRSDASDPFATRKGKRHE